MGQQMVLAFLVMLMFGVGTAAVLLAAGTVVEAGDRPLECRGHA